MALPPQVAPQGIGQPPAAQSIRPLPPPPAQAQPQGMPRQMPGAPSNPMMGDPRRVALMRLLGGG